MNTVHLAMICFTIVIVFWIIFRDGGKGDPK